MKYDGVLFDMDGTVLDTLSDLYHAVNYTLEHFGLPLVDRQQVRAALGNGAGNLIRSCMPADIADRMWEEGLAYYRPYYAAHCRIETQPYEGILALMERLKAAGVKLAVVSNKPDGAVKELAEVFFPGLLTEAIGERPGVPRKPDPASVLEGARRLGLEPSRCVYIGDSEVDVKTAKSAGMDGIAVTWGFRDEPELIAAGAEVLAHHARELEQLLLG